MLTLKFFIIYILISSTIIYLSRYLGYFDKPNKRGIHKSLQEDPQPPEESRHVTQEAHHG